MKLTLILLILFSILIIFLEFYFYCYIPKDLLMPIVGINAIIVTLILAYISFSQWQKNRLENEVLKEQLKLIIKYLEYMQNKTNDFFLIVKPDERILISTPISFSIINYNSLKELDDNKYFTQQLKRKDFNYQWFNEVNNNIIYNPFFPKKLFNIIKKLDTLNNFMSVDYMKNSYDDIGKFSAEEQLVMMKGFNKDDLNSKSFAMVRIPYDSNFLKIKDVINIYQEFNQELDKWFKENHININLNINYK
jgi:hypothetical protein